MLCSVFFAVSVEKLYDGMSQAQFETRELSFVLEQEGVFLNLLCWLFRDIPPNSYRHPGRISDRIQGISGTTGSERFKPDSGVEFVSKISTTAVKTELSVSRSLL